MNRLTSGRALPRTAIVIAGGLVVTMGSGIAMAAWSANGTGTAAAQAGTSSGVTGATASTTGGNLLYPTGAASVPVVVSVHNPNKFQIKVSSIVVGSNTAPSSVSGQNNTTSCHAAPGDTTGVTLVAGTYAVTGAGTIPAESDGVVVTSTNAVKMDTTSDNGCQNGVFNFGANGVTVNAASG